MTTTELDFICPDWPAPPNVRAASTTRIGGVSEKPWNGLNLATHVGDEPAHVQRNRELLAQALALPAEPAWLTQVHGTNSCDAAGAQPACEADASFATAAGQVCVVMTADCLPVLFCNRQGTRVAAAHAGWRGLAGGVLEASVAGFDDPADVLAWLGPAIGPQAFEVGEEVLAAFTGHEPQAAQAFVANRPGHWLADIYQLARLRLKAAGVSHIYGGGLCTFADAERFYSFRREPVTGRMASLIWLD